MLKKLALGALLVLTMLTVPASGHQAMVGDETVDYSKLKGGADGKTDCCNEKDCQWAVEWEFIPATRKWRFLVHEEMNNRASPLINVYVDDATVTKDNLTNKSKTAHWCGYFNRDVDNKIKTWHTYCAFVPPPDSVSNNSGRRTARR